MSDTHNTHGQEEQRVRSRRRFFNWAGQIATGISLASLGLATHPLSALARSKAPATPNGSPCLCALISCQANVGLCGYDYPNVIHYYTGGGRQPNCSTAYVYCTNTCRPPC